MSTKHKLSIMDLPIHSSPPKEEYVPYRKRICVKGAIRRTLSQNKDLHEKGVDLEREKILRGRSVSCPVPFKHIYYAHYLYIREFNIEEGDDYACLFM